jgi:hypothetical protein
MEASLKIQNFLTQVQNKWSRNLYLDLTYLTLTVLTGGALATGFYFYFQSGIPILGYGLCGLIGIFLGWRLWSTRESSKINLEQAALLVEQKYPELNNSLINALQLQRYLPDQQENKPPFSVAFIREHIQNTQTAIESIDPGSIISGKKTIPALNRFLGILLTLIIVTAVLPDFWTPILNPESTTQITENHLTKPELAKEPLGYKINNLSLILEFPGYSQLKRQIIKPSDGSIEALPGTEVIIQGSSNHPIEGAELVVNNRDHFIMSKINDQNLQGSLILREKGHYQFEVKQPSGENLLLDEKYSIALKQDQSPQIILFPANPKPVYYDTDTLKMFYEAHDDYGIQHIDLIAQITKVRLQKKVKHFRQPEKDSTGSYSWNLALENLQAGDKVQYFLEIKDNNNVTQPNIGQSEIYSFTIFDSRKERENLVKLQDELAEKMIALLAEGLVAGPTLKSASTLEGKNLLASHADALIEIIGLAQRITQLAQDLKNFPQPYLNLLTNLITKFTHIREEQIDTINKLQKTISKPIPASFTLDATEMLNDKMIVHLEQNILYLIKMTNRQKMDQVMDLDNELSKLTEALQEKFENLLDKDSPPMPEQLKEQINQIQQTLQKMMEKLAQQNQSAPDEFLNSKALENMSLEKTMDSLDKVKDLASKGKMDKAMEELKKVMKDLKKLANQLNQTQSSMDSMMDSQTLQKIDESAAKLELLEKKQKQVLQDTSEINQKLRSKQADQLDSMIQSFFAELLIEVKAIESILNEDSRYLKKHKAMLKTDALSKEEAKIRQEIKSLGQKTVDSSLNDDLGNNFKDLNKARQQLSKTLHKIDNLRTRSFQEFKNNLPPVQKKYEALKELAEMNELNEFNVLFKNTYPEIFRFQGRLHSNRNQRDDIADRLYQDLKEVTRRNAEISKKLGSLKRSIEKNTQSLLSNEEETQLNKLSKQENEISQQAGKIKRSFEKMNRENPLLPPSLSQGMRNAERSLKNAEERLQAKQIQRGINSENEALKSIQETRDQLSQMKNAGSPSKQGEQETPLRLGTGNRRDPRRGGSPRMEKEQVLLPSEDQYKVPRAFREEILDAMKKQTPKSYERLVNEYYKELVQ